MELQYAYKLAIEELLLEKEGPLYGCYIAWAMRHAPGVDTTFIDRFLLKRIKEILDTALHRRAAIIARTLPEELKSQELRL